MTVATSSEVIPKYSQINPLELQVTGDFSACTSDVQVTVLQGDQYLGSAFREDSPSLSFDINEAVALQGAPLKLQARCMVGPNFIAIPSFTASIVFELTQLDATVTRQFS